MLQWNIKNVFFFLQLKIRFIWEENVLFTIWLVLHDISGSIFVPHCVWMCPVTLLGLPWPSACCQSSVSSNETLHPPPPPPQLSCTTPLSRNRLAALLPCRLKCDSFRLQARTRELVSEGETSQARDTLKKLALTPVSGHFCSWICEFPC